MGAINLGNTIFLLGENRICTYWVSRRSQHFYYLAGGETEAGSTMKAIIKYDSEEETWEIEKKEILEKRKMHSAGVIQIKNTKDICPA